MDQFEKELIEAQEQRSNQWRDARVGKFTGSEVWKLLTEPRTKAAKEAGDWSDTAMTYIKTKVGEELTGMIHETGPAYPLVWGEEQEENAKNFYETRFEQKIRKAGFIAFTDHSGCTPDGYVGNSVVELKCPYNSTNHVEYLTWQNYLDLKDNKPEYWYQIQTEMLFAKMNKGLFISFDPRMIKDEHKMKVIDVFPDVDDQQLILDRIEKAIKTKISIIENLGKKPDIL
jgi:hypothetical protein